MNATDPLDAATAFIAQELLRESTSVDPRLDEAPLGDILLRPHQRDAVRRVRHALAHAHVALLADDPGMGKTFVALAVARGYATALVLAPAALLPMWRDAIARARLTHVRVRSLHHYSTHVPPRDDSSVASEMFVVIDEAHHVRTRHTQRFRAVAKAVSGADLLLLSATPVHNSACELQAMLSLAVGNRSDVLSDATLTALVIRRASNDVVPQLRRAAPIPIAPDPALLSALLALPAPLPAHDGAVAGALIRLGLLRAWCSSDAALEHALRRRVLRGEALRQALQSGRHPTQRELQTWILGEAEVQLAFPELLVQAQVEQGPLTEVLETHVSALRAILDEQQHRRANDVLRAAALRRIVHQHPGIPLVAFSQYASTVHALFRALSDIAGVAVVSGQQARIASGRISRLDALHAFAPRAHGKPPPTAHQRINILLTTDLLAEGVNLQDAGVVVHLDLPWTSALLTQREGRCARIGSLHDVVHVYAMQPPPDVERVLRQERRIRLKRALARKLVGTAAQRPMENRKTNAVQLATRLDVLLRAWHAPFPQMHRRTMRQPIALSSDRNAFLVLIHEFDRPLLVAGVERRRTRADGVRSRWRLSTSPRRLVAMIERITRHRGCNEPLQRAAHPPSPQSLRTIRCLLRRRAARQRLRTTLELSSIHAPRVQQAVAAALSVGLTHTPLAQRHLAAMHVSEARAMLTRVRGAAVEAALHEWLACRTATRFLDWVSTWRSYTALRGHAAAASATDKVPARSRYRALIVLERGAAHDRAHTAPLGFGNDIPRPPL